MFSRQKIYSDELTMGSFIVERCAFLPARIAQKSTNSSFVPSRKNHAHTTPALGVIIEFTTRALRGLIHNNY